MAQRRRRPRKKARPKKRSKKVVGKIRLRVRPIMGHEEAEVLHIIRSHDETDARYAARYYHEYFYSKVRAMDHVLVAVTQKNKVVGVSGYISDAKEPRGIFWLAWTYVRPEYRRFGVGNAILRRVEQALRKRGARKLYLNTSAHSIYKGAIRFYLDHGFKWEGYLRDYYRKGEDQIVLGKSI